MLQADMLGYREAGEPMQLARPDKYDTIEAVSSRPDLMTLVAGLTRSPSAQCQRWLVGNISTLYVPDLVVGETPACCSDHQSFDQQGFVSTWVFERNGPMCVYADTDGQCRVMDGEADYLLSPTVCLHTSQS
jgi:hypothetical protein